MSNVNDMMVSVCMITYNHEKFIGQAIQSVIDQKTNFKFELVIGEDFSSDKTRGICEKYVNEYSEIVKLLSAEKNIGAAKNFRRTYESCSGKYIAMLEGDDYWTDPYKLQKQVDFLETNLNYAICFTNANIREDKSVSTKSNMNLTLLDPNNCNKIVEQDELFTHNCIITLTTVFRSTKSELPLWFNEIKLGDWALHILNSLHGKIQYFNEVTATYRKHENGVFSSLSQCKQLINYLETGEIIRKNIEKKMGEKMLDGQRKRLDTLLKLSKESKQPFLYFKYLLLYRNLLTWKDVIKRCLLFVKE